MRAVVVARFGGADVLELRDLPDPAPGAGQVLVETEAIGVNYRDVYEREGEEGGGRPPFVAGVEGAGVVVAAGDGVADVSPGDRVAWVRGPGSYAERVVVDAERAVPVPDGLSAELAAASLLQGMTAQYLATAAYPIASGDTVVVHAGAGGVGRLLTQFAKARGARVIATTSGGEKEARALAAGADEVVGYDSFADAAHASTGGEGAAAVFDGVGRSTFAASLAALRPRGVLVLYGAASGQPDPIAPSLLKAGSLYLTRPSLADYMRTRAELLERAGDVFARAADGSLGVLIGGRYDLADARRAHEDLEARRTIGKLLLLPRGT